MNAIFINSENSKTSKPHVLCWDASSLSQVSNCDGVVQKVYLDHKFQWRQEGLNCESLAYKVVTA